MTTTQQLLQALIAGGVLDADDQTVRFGWPALHAFLKTTLLPERPVTLPAGTWGAKLIIGLTGNIAVGKSTVLEMLEQLGASVIDADALVHFLRQPGRAGYHAIRDLLGSEIVLPDGKIDVQELSSRAFADPALLRRLEEIFRPLVVAEVEQQARSSEQRVVVIEAIKLLEGELHKNVDQVWVVDAPRNLQIERLIQTRSMSREQAALRVDAQNPQAQKLAAADVVIQNAGDVLDTWQQVVHAWRGVLDTLIYAGWLDEQLISKYIEARCTQAGFQVQGRKCFNALYALALATKPEGAISFADAVRVVDSTRTA